MKVALIYNLNKGKCAHEAEFDSQVTINALTKALSASYYVAPIESTENFGEFISQLMSSKADIFFNIAEGYSGPAREAVYPALYDQLNLNFTGPDATNLIVCHNKALTKKLLNFANILVPRGLVITDVSSLVNKLPKWNYPFIVKLNSEGSGMGLSEKSIVNNFVSLKKQFEETKKAHKTAVLVEEYIEGRDMSMAYIEGIGALGPCEVVCRDHHTIYDFEYKTTKDSIVDIFHPTDLSQTLLGELKSTTEKIGEILDIRGYAKVDYRVTNDGKIYVLEVNGQVSFHPLGEFMVCVESEGYTMEKIVYHIVEYASNKQYKKSSVGVNF